MFHMLGSAGAPDVIGAALGLLEAGGPEALTMRRLADAVGLPVASLYRYVANKDEVLDRVLDEVFATIATPPEVPGYWSRGLAERLRALSDAFARHRGAVALLAGRPLVMPAALRFLDQVVGILRRGGLREADAAMLARVAVALVAGHALLDAGDRAAEAAAGPGAVRTYLRSLPGRDYPHLAATIEHAFARSAGEVLDEGIRTLLAGLASTTARPPD